MKNASLVLASLILTGCGASMLDLSAGTSQDELPAGSTLAQGIATLRVLNNSGIVLEAVFFVPVEQRPGWGENLLKGERVFPGRDHEFYFEPGLYDLAVDLAEGDCFYSAEQGAIRLEDGDVYEFVLHEDTNFFTFGDCEEEQSEPFDDGDDVEKDESEPIGDVIDVEEVVDQVLNASWQIIGANDFSSIVASAFAVDDTLLATNAHVVFALAEVLAREEGIAIAVQHESGVAVSVSRMWVHPDFNGDSTTSPDIGIIETDLTLPVVLDIADQSTLEELHVFDEMRLCGFPADVTAVFDMLALITGEGFRPRATCLSGAISALRPFDPSVPATSSNSQLIQHDIATTGGTSGSPLFNDSGQVVAINAATTLDESGLNRFAPRADTLLDLMTMIDVGTVTPIPIESLPDPDNTYPLREVCSTSYYNREWQIGFDVPLGFLGPDPVFRDFLFGVEFVRDDPDSVQAEYTMLQIQVHESIRLDFDAYVQWWIELVGEDLYDLLGQEQFVTTNGSPAHLLRWLYTSSSGDPFFDILIVEAWVESDFGMYRLEGSAFRNEFQQFGDTLELAVRSICAD